MSGSCLVMSLKIITLVLTFPCFPFSSPWWERLGEDKKSYIVLKERIFLRHCQECSDVAISRTQSFFIFLLLDKGKL